MTRVAHLSPDEAVGDLRVALERVPKNLMATLAQAQGPAVPCFALISAILSETRLDPHLRELLILRVAAFTGAEYEWIQHEPIARAHDVTDAQVAALRDGDLVADCLTPRERAVLAFAEQMLARGRPDDEAFAALGAVADLGDREIVEATLTVAVYRALAQVMVALDVDLDPPNADDELAGVLAALAHSDKGRDTNG